MIYQETDNKNYIDDVSVIAIGTLRSDNGDANKNVAKKIEFVSFQTFSRFFQVAQLRQSRETMSEREGERNVHKIVMHVQSCCFANFGYVNMIPNSFGAATRIIQDTASFHTQ